MRLQEYNYEYDLLSRKQTVQRNKKRKEVLGVGGSFGKREGSGRMCLVAATVILEMGFRLISLTWLRIPALFDAGLCKKRLLQAAAGFLFPRPEAGSRLPPCRAASPAATWEPGNRTPRPAPPGASRAPRAERPPGLPQHPFPAPLHFLPVSALRSKK